MWRLKVKIEDNDDITEEKAAEHIEKIDAELELLNLSCASVAPFTFPLYPFPLSSLALPQKG